MKRQYQYNLAPLRQEKLFLLPGQKRESEMILGAIRIEQQPKWEHDGIRFLTPKIGPGIPDTVKCYGQSLPIRTKLLFSSAHFLFISTREEAITGRVILALYDCIELSLNLLLLPGNGDSRRDSSEYKTIESYTSYRNNTAYIPFGEQWQGEWGYDGGMTYSKVCFKEPKPVTNITLPWEDGVFLAAMTTVHTN